MANPKTGPKPIFIGNIVTPVGRLSFPHLENPDSGRQYSDDKYKGTILLPKKETDFSLLQAKALECAQQAWPGKVKSLNDFQHPFRDGDQKADLAGYKGCLYLTCKSKRRPLIVDSRKANLSPEEVYGGCFCRFVVTACSYVQAGKPGVTFLLDAVQKVRDGDRFGGGGASADAFPDDLPESGVGPDAFPAEGPADDPLAAMMK